MNRQRSCIIPLIVLLVAACTAPATMPAITTPAQRPTETLVRASGATPGPPATPTLTLVPTLTPVLSLRRLAQACGMQIGAAVAVEPLRSEAIYAEILAREFNMLTPENVMKFGPLRPSRERYDFHDADAVVEFAERHAMRVRGHVLVWHQQLPAWLTEGNWTRDELIELLQEHITTVVGRYRGRIAAWDVVNEAVADDGSLRETVWSRGIGPEYIEMAFRWAHEADPDALLFYNDYGGEGLGRKSDGIYELVGDLVARGVPIHGVGLQMHVSLDWSPKSQEVAANIARLSELGLEIHITEMDVRIRASATGEELAEQARVYRDLLGVCLSAPGCGAFVLWGFTDRHSWIPHFFTGWDAALIFDESYRPKPAYDLLVDTVSRQ